jgi:hypothetical protein
VLSVLEPAVRTQGTEKGLLERVLGSIRAESAAQEPEHVAPMLVVEPLERGDRHGLHHPRQTLSALDL